MSIASADEEEAHLQRILAMEHCLRGVAGPFPPVGILLLEALPGSGPAPHLQQPPSCELSIPPFKRRE